MSRHTRYKMNCVFWRCLLLSGFLFLINTIKADAVDFQTRLLLSQQEPMNPLYDNGAFLNIYPKNGPTVLVDPPLTLTTGYWNNRLHLLPYSDFFKDNTSSDWASIIQSIIRASVSIEGADPQKTSDLLGDHFKNGMNLYAHMKYTFARASFCPMGAELSTNAVSSTHFSGDLFQLFFNKGLKPGSEIDVSSMRQFFAFYTDLSYRQAFKNRFVSEITPLIRKGTGDFLDVSTASVGIGTHLLFGHNIITSKATNGRIKLSADANNLDVDAAFSIYTSNSKKASLSDIGELLPQDFSVRGLGMGFDASVAFYGTRSYLTTGFQNLGFLRYFSVQKGNYWMRGTNLNLDTILKAIDNNTLFKGDSGLIHSNFDSTFSNSSGISIPLPGYFFINTGKRFTNSESYKWKCSPLLSSYVDLNLTLRQTLIAGFTRTYIPECLIGFENGFFNGIIPLTYTLGVGGSDLYFSQFDFHLITSRISFSSGIKSFGSVICIPRHGFLIQTALTFLLRS